MKENLVKNVARGFIAIVLILNVQAALLFIANPAAYTAGFEISGIPGEKIVQGMGILFLMWNVPYGFALAEPVRFRTSLVQAILMQAIGLIGETILLVTLPPGHPMLSLTALRFIAFDGGGLILLIISWWVTRKTAVEHQ